MSCAPGHEEEAIEQLARRAASLRRPGVQVLARLAGVSTESEAALREAAARALARACGVPAETGDASALGQPFPILELHVASYAALAQTPIVAEFVARLATCAGGEAAREPRLLETALRLGLGAFLESLP